VSLPLGSVLLGNSLLLKLPGQLAWLWCGPLRELFLSNYRLAW
jgi:hypothetical protein